MRSKVKEPVAQLLKDLPLRLPVFKSQKPLTGSNVSTQYNAEYSYVSVMSSDLGRIKVEMSVREPLMLPAQKKEALTLLMSPFIRKAAIPSLRPVLRDQDFEGFHFEGVTQMLTQLIQSLGV